MGIWDEQKMFFACVLKNETGDMKRKRGERDIHSVTTTYYTTTTTTTTTTSCVIKINQNEETGVTQSKKKSLHKKHRKWKIETKKSLD